MNIVNEYKFNTNNAWGFGGGIGTDTTYDNGLRNRKGRACFRHLPAQSFNRWFVVIHENFNIEISTGVFTKHISSQPKGDVYVYCDNNSYRALVGECKDFKKLFGYTPENAKLFKIIQL